MWGKTAFICILTDVLEQEIEKMPLPPPWVKPNWCLIESICAKEVEQGRGYVAVRAIRRGTGNAMPEPAWENATTPPSKCAVLNRVS